MGSAARICPASAWASVDVIGEMGTKVTSSGRTLLHIARENNLGLLELMAANPGIDPWLPPEGRTLVLPMAHILPDAPREGIVINLGDLRLYRFLEHEVLSWPVGIGRRGHATPIGRSVVIDKAERPTWWPTPSMRSANPKLPRKVPPGPENPLGSHALYLDWPSFAIHGTNKPWGVGRPVSQGCIRLYPEHIHDLYRMTPRGTSVLIVDQPVKLGRNRAGKLMLEIHPSKAQLTSLEGCHVFSPEVTEELRSRIEEHTESGTRISWSKADEVDRERLGIPILLERRSG